MNSTLAKLNQDPMQLANLLWSDVIFYDKQIEIIQSVKENDETYVVAGNQLGKDFVAGFIALSFFLVPQMYFPAEYVKSINKSKVTDHWLSRHQRRVVTTSVAEHHLGVLWGEISRFLMTSRIPLSHMSGGDLVVNHQEIRWRKEQASKNPMNYLVGKVSGKGEGMAGHHAAYTLLIIDEASGVDNMVHEQGQGWAKKFLVFGNPNPTVNFFYKNVKAGDLVAS